MPKPVENTLRQLPSVDRLLRHPALAEAITQFGHNPVRDVARQVLDSARGSLQSASKSSEIDAGRDGNLDSKLCQSVLSALKDKQQASITPVFNLTGTVLHTNLGRALLPQQAIESLCLAAANPVNLEFDLVTGERGERDAHLEAHICELTGAEAATVVNNNAAAVVLVLAALACRREVIISRGELVEIGGSFRIPEVMGSAGCHLKEVGTTNRSSLSDYAEAINGRTALIMKVHTSNYEIRGFTGSVSEQDLAGLARDNGLPMVTDLGSGTLVDLGQYGLPREPTVAESIRNGADLVTFSGDKLLGGPQAGIIAGRKVLVDRLRRHPLKRALRIDKLTLVALLAVLQLYRDPQRLADRLPTLKDLTRPLADIEALGEMLIQPLQSALAKRAVVSLVPCSSQVGSGALPADTLDSRAICLEINDDKPDRDARLNALALAFRSLPRPVIGRLSDGRLLFDLRCLYDAAGFINQLDSLPPC